MARANNEATSAKEDMKKVIKTEEERNEGKNLEHSICVYAYLDGR